MLSHWLDTIGVEPFWVTSFALPFLLDQLYGSIVWIVRHLYDDAPFDGCTVPSFGYTNSLSGETINARID